MVLTLTKFYHPFFGVLNSLPGIVNDIFFRNQLLLQKFIFERQEQLLTLEFKKSELSVKTLYFTFSVKTLYFTLLLHIGLHIKTKHILTPRSNSKHLQLCKLEGNYSTHLVHYCRPYLFVGAENLKFIYFAYKSCCLMQHKSRLQHVSSYSCIKYYIISVQCDTVVGTMRTGATAGSEGRTACLQLTKTTDMQAAILNLSTSLLGFSFEVVS
jgi:hypothetical protein